MKDFYKYWPIFKTLPAGWIVDKTCGSPLAGHVFITNGRSVLRGQQRALLPIEKEMPPSSEAGRQIKTNTQMIHQTKEKKTIIDYESAKIINELARAKFKRKIMQELLFDMKVCQIEGWPVMDYLKEIKELINSIGRQNHGLTQEYEA